MTLAELIRDKNFSMNAIFARLCSIDNDDDEDYIGAITSLLMLEPISGWKIFLEEPSLPNLHIYGIRTGSDNDEEEEHYAMELEPWEYWLGAEIHLKNINLTHSEIIAECLYEMNYFGVDNYKYSQIKQATGKMKDEI